jgi:transposase
MSFLAVEPHLPADELYRRYRKADRPSERSQWHLLWLKAGGQSAPKIREVIGYSEKWICEIVHRYNEGGPEAIRDRRRDHPGGEPMLSSAQQEELAVLVGQGAAPDGEPWSGPKVARWIEKATGRKNVHNQRGWEYLRRLGFTPQTPRRRHEAASLEEQAAFKKSASSSGQGTS